MLSERVKIKNHVKAEWWASGFHLIKPWHTRHRKVCKKSFMRSRSFRHIESPRPYHFQSGLLLIFVECEHMQSGVIFENFRFNIPEFTISVSWFVQLHWQFTDTGILQWRTLRRNADIKKKKKRNYSRLVLKCKIKHQLLHCASSSLEVLRWFVRCNSGLFLDCYVSLLLHSAGFKSPAFSLVKKWGVRKGCLQSARGLE